MKQVDTLDSKGWGATWSPKQEIDIQKVLTEHANSVLGKKIFDYLVGSLGDLSGKRSIEIGCGGAIYSLLLAQRGVDITLLDYSIEALLVAERNLRALNLSANLIQADAFNPPVVFERYDIALSFGTVEHYKPPRRLDICMMHAHLVHSGGVVIIETPNAAFIPHEVLKWALQMTGKWPLGYEKGFSYGEMIKTGEALKLRNVQIVGSSFRSDISHYYHLVRNSRSIKRFLPAPKPNLRQPMTQKKSILDDRFSRSIALLGVKS